jgi:rRNA processing protein Gar1
MRELGRVLHIARSGRIIVKTGIGTIERNVNGFPVLDINGRKIGKIQEIFGPVISPYASVEPARQRKPADVVGAQVFIPNEVFTKNKRGKGHSGYKANTKVPDRVLRQKSGC